MHRSAKALAVHERNQHEREQRRHLASPDFPVEPLTLSLIHAMAGLPPAVTVSIYMPTHRPSTERRQDHIRIKNLLHQARLRINQVDGEDRAVAIISPIEELVANPQFWTHPADGLVLFCREGSIKLLRTSAPMPEMAIVSEHFHVKPLMPLLQDDNRFHLLVLALNDIRLYQGGRSSIIQIDLPGVPTSMDEGITQSGPEHLEDVLTKSGSKPVAIHDVSPVEGKHAMERIENHFRRIDACLCALLKGETAPLVLAGVADFLPIYAGVNHYHHLEPTRIPCDPDTTAITTLHDHALRIAALSVAKRQETAVARYAQLSGSAQASADLPSILRNGNEGRIDHLFVSSDRERWGTYDRINDKVREHQPRWPEDDDLLNLAIITALAHRSVVQVTPQALMPNHSDIAAIFRY